jgi:hypothetical protein
MAVKGQIELERFFDEVPGRIQKNILRGAMRAGAQELRDAAQENLRRNGSVKTGKLLMGLEVGTRVNGDVVTGYVRTTGEHAFIGPLLEYGTRPHTITAKNKGLLFFGGLFAKNVRHPGFRPKPFMRPAVDTSGAAVLNASSEYFEGRMNDKRALGL